MVDSHCVRDEGGFTLQWLRFIGLGSGLGYISCQEYVNHFFEYVVRYPLYGRTWLIVIGGKGERRKICPLLLSRASSFLVLSCASIYSRGTRADGTTCTARCRLISLKDRATVCGFWFVSLIHELCRSDQRGDDGAFPIAVMPHVHTEGGLTAAISESQVWSMQCWHARERYSQTAV